MVKETLKPTAVSGHKASDRVGVKEARTPSAVENPDGGLRI
jgi:hypothetical protein